MCVFLKHLFLFVVGSNFEPLLEVKHQPSCLLALLKNRLYQSVGKCFEMLIFSVWISFQQWSIIDKCSISVRPSVRLWQKLNVYFYLKLKTGEGKQHTTIIQGVRVRCVWKKNRQVFVKKFSHDFENIERVKMKGRFLFFWTLVFIVVIIVVAVATLRITEDSECTFVVVKY